MSDPLLVTLSTPKRPLPLNPPSLPDLPPLPPSEPSKPSSPLDQPPVEPLIPIPWNIHHWEYSLMEMYREPTPVENPLEDPDSPMEDTPPLEPEPFIPYKPDVPRGQTHTLSPEESPIEPWEAYLTQPSSPVSRKHSLSPTSPSSAPIHQRTSREGSYQSITPSASSPIAGTSPQSQGYQSTSPGVLRSWALIPIFRYFPPFYFALSVTHSPLVPSRAARTVTKSPDKSPDRLHD